MISATIARWIRGSAIIQLMEPMTFLADSEGHCCDAGKCFEEHRYCSRSHFQIGKRYPYNNLVTQDAGQETADTKYLGRVVSSVLAVP